MTDHPDVIENRRIRRAERTRRALLRAELALPASVYLALRCPQCQLRMQWTGNWWTCPKAHGKLVSIDIMLLRIEEAFGHGSPYRMEAIDVLKRHARIVGAHWISAVPVRRKKPKGSSHGVPAAPHDERD